MPFVCTALGGRGAMVVQIENYKLEPKRVRVTARERPGLRGYLTYQVPSKVGIPYTTPASSLHRAYSGLVDQACSFRREATGTPHDASVDGLRGLCGCSLLFKLKVRDAIAGVRLQRRILTPAWFVIRCCLWERSKWDFAWRGEHKVFKFD